MDKTIKDLKERNDKLKNQYELLEIRCITTESENKKLKEENENLKSQLDFIEEQNKYINKLETIISKVAKHIKLLKEFDEANFGEGAYLKDWEELLEELGEENE